MTEAEYEELWMARYQSEKKLAECAAALWQAVLRAQAELGGGQMATPAVSPPKPKAPPAAPPEPPKTFSAPWYIPTGDSKGT